MIQDFQIHDIIEANGGEVTLEKIIQILGKENERDILDKLRMMQRFNLVTVKDGVVKIVSMLEI